MKSYFQPTSVSHAYIYLCGLGFWGDVCVLGGLWFFLFIYLFISHIVLVVGGKGEFGWCGLE